MPDSSKTLKVNFNHGLGDCVMFAHQIPLYQKAGWDVTIGCNADKRILFQPTGASLSPVEPAVDSFSWDHPPGQLPRPDQSLVFWNKAGWNLSTSPMPDIGSQETHWPDYVQTRLDVRPWLDAEAVAEAERFLAGLPRPVVLMHLVGNSFQNTKSLSPEVSRKLYQELLDRMEGTLVLLDWDQRVPRLNHYRVRHLTDDWARIDITRLIALLDRSDLIIGIDSGPFHLARYTDTAALGIFWHQGHHPVRYCLPRERQACIVPRHHNAELSHRARLDYNILLCDQPTPEASFIATHACRMLEGPRYLKASQLARDLRLQQMVRDWSRGGGNEVSQRMDRDRGWDAILRECSRRFDRPRILETGCARTRDDWRGAGNSTVLLAEYTACRGGSFTSVDLDARHCQLASSMVVDFAETRIVTGDSVEFLEQWKEQVDFLYLDSMDTFIPGSGEHALREAQAALPKLHAGSIIAFDDTAYSKKGYTGKGTLAVPYLLKNGWRIFFSGYQTVLVRES